jgi:hypothetical protein
MASFRKNFYEENKAFALLCYFGESIRFVLIKNSRRKLNTQMQVIKITLSLIFIFLSQLLIAQLTEPMYAIRKDKKWEFYDNNNELLFPNKADIGPLMVYPYYHGWAKVQQLKTDGEEIYFQDGVIDEKGNFKDLGIVPEGFLIMGIDLIEGQKVIFWSNWNERFFMSPKGDQVPTRPSETANWLGGRLLSNQESPGTYEIWDILEAKVLFKVEAEALGRYSKDLLAAKKNGLWGAINLDGKWVIEPKFKAAGAFNLEDEYAFEPEVAFRNGILAVSEDSVKWGFVDIKGKWKIEAQYTDVLYIGKGHWMGQTENGWQLINPKGKIVKKLLFEDTPDYALIDQLIRNADKIYNLKGKLLHQGADAYQILGDGFFVARTEGQLSLYKGKKFIKKLPKEIELMKLEPFSNGVSTVKVFKEGGIGYLGFINQKGDWMIEPNIRARYGSDEIPRAMKTHIHIWDGKKHTFYKHDGTIITEITSDGSWEMFMPLQDGNQGFWAPI